ncbi:molybdopterin-dependent oxidoreductase [Mycolicibacterium sp. P1-5]|uniref:molybdopterin-dependent oxidoreductase n=1 Tax=Mycolicibacterium sp. P1-5 TaxID=2024617 RepID=UPI0011EF86F6|nr:molybdopterin-dependent oxidoreductase [Mycolicibacterium sp. P1-5]KAA0103481.1 oxidoreductase [Mycolicibacterium sp. P1-5]
MARSTVGLRMGAGVAAAAVALGVVQLTAAFFSPAADARTAVGTAVINATPGPVKEWAIQTFGTADKLFLSVAVIAVVAALAAAAAIWERSRIPVGSVAFALAAVAGSAAVLARPGARPVDIIPTLLGAVCGIVVLRLLTSGRITEGRATAATDAEGVDPGRRLSLATLGFVGLGLLGGVAGTVISRRLHSVSGDRNSFALPSAPPPSPVPADVTPAGVQLPNFITPNGDFYRIDTALSVPQLSRADFRLRIHGMVDREVTYTFDDLKKFEPIEKVVTLTCVSNPVGGDLISNATWTGYRVRDLLRDAGIHADADMVLSTSVDGFTAGTPVEALTDGRDAMLAIGMNGVPLPVEHGYPARLVVPGLYGYVSATKWLVDLELTRFDKVQAYWSKLGWSERGPIKTESRIDVPRDGQKVGKGPATFGGVAWAQNRGVRAVEVRIDGGPWQPAQLGAAYSNDTWRLWSFPWTATQAGTHAITVRATDNAGAVQTEDQAPPAPDGATGWHSVSFEVV